MVDSQRRNNGRMSVTAGYDCRDYFPVIKIRAKLARSIRIDSSERGLCTGNNVARNNRDTKYNSRCIGGQRTSAGSIFHFGAR